MVNMVHLLTGIMRYAISSLTFPINLFLPSFQSQSVYIQYNTASIGLALGEYAGAFCPPHELPTAKWMVSYSQSRDPVRGFYFPVCAITQGAPLLLTSPLQRLDELLHCDGRQ
jgi:hypothetical protein